MNNLRGVWEGESNESMYERCGTVIHTNEVKCGAVEWVKIRVKSL